MIRILRFLGACFRTCNNRPVHMRRAWKEHIHVNPQRTARQHMKISLWGRGRRRRPQVRKYHQYHHDSGMWVVLFIEDWPGGAGGGEHLQHMYHTCRGTTVHKNHTNKRQDTSSGLNLFGTRSTFRRWTYARSNNKRCREPSHFSLVGTRQPRGERAMANATKPKTRVCLQIQTYAPCKPR